MKFLHCRGSLWQNDDFDKCVTVDLLQILLPAVSAGISAVLLLIGHMCKKAEIQRTNSYRYGYAEIHQEQIQDVDEVDAEENNDFADHQEYPQRISQLVERNCSRAQFVTVVELISILVIISSFMIVQRETTSIWPSVLAATTWLYIFGLVCVRLLYLKNHHQQFSIIWYHTTLVYICNVLCLAIPFRSSIIHPESGLNQMSFIIRFISGLVLFIIVVSVSCPTSRTFLPKTDENLHPSREPAASLLSLASFSWVDAIVWQGYWKPLELKDVWNLRNNDLANATLSSFRQTKKTASLLWSLVSHFKNDLAIQALWAAFASLFIFAPTLLLRVILEYVHSPENTPKNVAWLFVFLLLVTSTVAAVGNGQALFIGRRICIRLRAVIIGEVYSKALRRKASAGFEKALGETGNEIGIPKGQANIGAIINLMAVDSFKVSEVCSYLHFLVAAVPVQVIIAVVLLYQILGWSAVAGIGVMILLMPINYLISSRFSQIQKKIMATTDKRIHTTNEVLQNIRIIKYFAWEERFKHVVNDSRTAELKQLRKRYVLWALAATSWYGSPMLITFLSFLCYTVVEKKNLDAPIAFTALSLFNVLRVPLDQLADMITNVLQTKVSVDRVEEFLREEETDKYQLKNEHRDTDSFLIGFKEASFSWGSKEQAISRGTISAFMLEKLNIEFIPGALNLIAGPTGSGKTSLLMALLGEMTHLKGSVYLPGFGSREDLPIDPVTGLADSVAYCAQQPWLVNDTIKANILFASPLDENRYQSVLIACSLEHDMRILDHGDETEVGEKGISLSGGQKQRISLARALYSNSTHLLLDDCLSAVDSHTAKWIYEYAIAGPLMQGRTCLLVTHNVALCIPQAKMVVVLENGRVVMQGDPETVVGSGALGSDELLMSGLRSRPHSRLPSRVPSITGELPALANSVPKVGTINQNSITKEDVKLKEKLNKAETKTEGGVDWKVYRLYLCAMGPWWYWAVVIVIFCVQQLGAVTTSVWIREWAAKYDDANPSANFVGNNIGWSNFFFNTLFPVFVAKKHQGSGSSSYIIRPNEKINVWFYLGVYAMLGIFYTIASFFREFIVFSGSLRASNNIHKNLLHNIMRARIRFFDCTPLGRIMNRFSKDVEAIDQEVAPVALGMIHSLGSVIAIVVLITVITPGFFAVGVFITALYWLIGIFYLRASRDLKRIESIQRSPLYQHFGETLNGVSTIRAYGDERRFARENLAKIDDHNRPFFYLWACNRWLGFRVDIAGAFVSFFAGVFVVLSVGSIDAGLAGLSLTYAITFTDNVLWVVRLYAMNEQNMNSVERIREYLEVDQEAAEIIEDHRPPTSWPSKGAVTFMNYSSRYRCDLDMVLKNVSFEIKPGEKVGIVGRTGAGKSSLTLALFRSLEAESGKIIMDGIDIATIGLRDLRQSITMVPQDPTLFSGNIRTNLDPFGIHTDGEIFAALKQVQLIDDVPEPAAPVVGDHKSVNKNIFLDLQSHVAESGQNLSQGQRQLVCLARGLLRAPKILVMDEATGSLDYATDYKIQITLRKMKSTIITIAHRLKSVCDYDKIIVLDQGAVKEIEHPHLLLKNKDSLFYGMCEASGELETLQVLAKKAFNGDNILIEMSDGH